MEKLLGVVLSLISREVLGLQDPSRLIEFLQRIEGTISQAGEELDRVSRPLALIGRLGYVK